MTTIAKIVLLLIVAVGSAAAQEARPVPKVVDLAPCEKVLDTFEAAAEKFNAGSENGVKIEMMCSYSQPEKDIKPDAHYPLTPVEVLKLNNLRDASTAAYTTEVAYEKYLLARHGHPEMSFGDPCWHYIGIVSGEDYITEKFDTFSCGITFVGGDRP